MDGEQSIGSGSRRGRGWTRFAARQAGASTSTHCTAVALTLTLALVLALAGCGLLAGPEGPRVPPEQRAAYDAAMGRLPGDVPGATAALEAFIERYPSSLLADDAVEQLSQLAFAEGREEEGVRWLSLLLSRYPDADRAAPARLRFAQIEYGRDRRPAARSLLAPLDLSALSLTDRRAALRLRVALALTPVERLESLAALRTTLLAESVERARDPGATARLRLRLDAVDRQLAESIRRASAVELEEVLEGLDGRRPAPSIALELARRAVDAAQLELAEERLARAADLVRSELGRSELRQLESRLVRLREIAAAEAELPPLRALVGQPRPRTDDARGTLGVVLPLSGDFAAYGQESLRGILLAADLFAESESEATGSGYPDQGAIDAPGLQRRRSSELRLLVRDSGGDPGRAAAAVRELADERDLLAVIGPIFSDESLAAADAADAEGVPLIALSTREDLAAERRHAFRTRTRPSDEIGVLVGHAFETLGAERFAVLYPRTRYGRGMRKLYWEAVTARGGKLVAASSYDPDSVDFAGAIRDMIGHRFLTAWERKALAERDDILRAARRLEPEQAALLREAAYGILGPEGVPLPPIVDFDVLFIPDAADKIALIAPALAFHEVQDVTLLGPNDWLDPELLRVARRHVSGAVISTPFHPSSELPFVTEFVEGYRNTFESEPGPWAAEAYDATNIVLVQLASGRRGRDALRDGLLDTRAYPGATGVLTMHPNGNARRRPFLLRVSGRRFQPLD